MDDVVAVHVSESLDELIDDIFNQLRLQSVRAFFEHFEEVVLNVFENQINDSFSPEGIPQFDDIGIFHVFQNFDFSHGDFADKLVVLALLEFFYCEKLFGFVGPTLEDNSIGAFADHRNNLVFLHFIDK